MKNLFNQKWTRVVLMIALILLFDVVLNAANSPLKSYSGFVFSAFLLIAVSLTYVVSKFYRKKGKR